TQEQAIGHILISLALLLILPAVGLGIASTSLVGHALGRNDTADAYRWGWEVVRVAMLMMALLGLPLWLFPQHILGIFTPDQHLIELGSWPLRITGLNIVFEVTNRKSTRLNSSHVKISYAVFCLKKKNITV